MTEPRSLLVATDFSAEAGFAARRAAALAKQTSASVLLAHVLPDSLPAALHVQAAARAQEALAALTAELQRDGVAVSPKLLSGDVAAEIAAAAAGHDAVVLGARGQGTLLDFALGRTSLRVVRGTRRPALVVKRPGESPYRRLLAAVDFSEPAFAAAACGARLAPDGVLHLVNAFEVDFESTLRLAGVDEAKVEDYRREARGRAMAALEAFAARLAVPRERLWPAAIHGYPPRVICEQAARVGAELIVIGKHRAGLLERALIGSVALQVLENAPCDVLVVPEGAA
ncbi:MAG TPA: universal stress protein [Burkholderiales bacterium]